jgi:hypothetical protein
MLIRGDRQVAQQVDDEHRCDASDDPNLAQSSDHLDLTERTCRERVHRESCGWVWSSSWHGAASASVSVKGLVKVSEGFGQLSLFVNFEDKCMVGPCVWVGATWADL